MDPKQKSWRQTPGIGLVIWVIAWGCIIFGSMVAAAMAGAPGLIWLGVIGGFPGGLFIAIAIVRPEVPPAQRPYDRHAAARDADPINKGPIGRG